MACEFVTSKARILNGFHERGLIGDNYQLLSVADIDTINRETRLEAERVLNGAVPVEPFALGLGESNKAILIPRDDLFMRIDAAEGTYYEENAKYVGNYDYPLSDRRGYNEDQLSAKITEILEGIGVGVEFKDLGDVRGMADTIGKMVYLSHDKADIGTLTEEAAHMFVSFIRSNNPKLYNRMMADVTKLPLYAEVKEKYLPIYNDLNRVREEAIGQALREYLVLERNDAPTEELSTWFDKVLELFKRAMAAVGISSIYDYHNVFQITAKDIIGGKLQGKFDGNGTFLQIAEEVENEVETAEEDTEEQKKSRRSIAKLDAIDKQLTIEQIPQADGTTKRTYMFAGNPLKYSVTERIKAKNKEVQPAETPFSRMTSEVGNRIHSDLMNMFKMRLDPTFNFTAQSGHLPKIAQFVDSVLEEFPRSTIRTEVKITDGSVGATVDLLIVDEFGRAHVLDYKTTVGSTTYLKPDWEEQLKDYKRILKSNYGFEKFGQIRIIPISTRYEGKADNQKLKSIDIGDNKLQPQERSFLNPLPLSTERQGNVEIDRLLDYLNEELARTKAMPQGNEEETNAKLDRMKAIQTSIAEVQIAQDVTPLTVVAESDTRRMKAIMAKADPTAQELRELWKLTEHYKDFVANGYAQDKDGNLVEELAEAAQFANLNNLKAYQKLEEFFNKHEINTKIPNKPTSRWSRLMRLSDYDNPAFQALQRLLNKGFNEKEIKLRKEKEEILAIIEQVARETGKRGFDSFKPILQEGTPKLINIRDKSWYDMHKQMAADPATLKTLEKWFDKDKWNEYFEPILEAYKKRNRPSDPDNKKLTDAYERKVANFKTRYARKYGIGQANSRFFTVPEQFLNKAWTENVRDKPDSGLAKLYNKYLEINEFAAKNCDISIGRTFLPYVRKSTMDAVLNNPLDFKNLKNNAFNSLKSYEWETMEVDSDGQRVYTIPLRFGTAVKYRGNDQSYDLGEMLMLWTESVYDNAYLQQTQDSAHLFGLALEKSKEVIMKGREPQYRNGELRTKPTNDETLSQYQEYLHMYYNGITNEDSDIDFMGYSMHKTVKGAVRWFSAKTLALVPFSALANITGGFSNAVVIGSKGRYFTNAQLGKAIYSLHDAKIRAFISLIDVDNNTFDRERASDLSINKVNRLLTWDNVFVLQKKGDWLIQNSVLGAMGQNYTVKNGKIVRKEEGDKSMLEALDYDADGKVRIEGLDLTNEEHYKELLNWRERVRSINSEIIGTTSQQDKFLAGNTLAGQLILQFRRWMLPMGTSRFGPLRYNKNLDEFQYGRYRSVASSVLDKRIFTALAEFIKEQKSASFQEILRDRFDAAKAVNPTLEYDEFIRLYKENARSVVVEAILVASVSAILYGLKEGADGEEPNVVERFLIRALTRTSSELSFWYSVDSFMNIVQVPIPLLSFLEDIVGLMKNVGGQGLGIITGDEELMEEATPLEDAGRMFIGVNAYYRFMDELDRDIDE